MELLKLINSKILWGTPMLILLLFTGVSLLIKTRAAVFFHFGFMMKNTLFTLFKRNKSDGGISPFAAVSTALAATVGTGNITGVALAIRIGGPGAVFWMWIAGLFGMVIKYTEVTLAVKYREKKEGGFKGGPMYYMAEGLSSKYLAYTFCIFAVLSSFGIGNMVQANAFSNGMKMIFSFPAELSGFILCLVCFFVLVGGIKRISSVSEILIPIMAAIYMLAAGYILAVNSDKIPSCFELIIKSAFSKAAPIGGFSGAAAMHAIRTGIAKGLFTNEAGLGSASIAHSAANSKHPVLQGMWGAFEVFFDTIIMCSMTAFAVIISGTWYGDVDNAYIAHAAFESYLPKGGFFVSFGIVMFAFASITAWYYYGESCMDFLFKGKGIKIYRFFYIIACYVGCISEITIVWEAADTLNSFMMLPNIAALLLLGNEAGQITKKFFKKTEP